MHARMDKYLELGRGHMTRVLARAKTNTEAPPVTVTALSGLHAGETVALNQTKRFTISGQVGADVFLLDDIFIGASVDIEAEQSVLGTLIRVRTETSYIMLNGEPLLPDEVSCLHRLPVELALGDVRLRVGVVANLPTAVSSTPGTALVTIDAQDQDADDMPLYRRPVRAAAAAVIAVALIGTGWLADRQTVPARATLSLPVAAAPTFAEPSPTPQTLPTQAEVELTPAWAAPSPTKNDPTTALAAIEVTDNPPPPTDASTIMAGSPLSEYLSMIYDKDGVMRVEGQLPPDMMPMWNELHAVLDSGSSEPMVTQVKALPDLVSFPAIATIRHGDDPAVVFISGKVAHPGDVVDGWTISEVRADEIILTRRGESRSLTF